MRKLYGCALFLALIFHPMRASSQSGVFINSTVDNYLRQNRPDFYREWGKLEKKNIDGWTLSDWTNLSDLIIIGEATKIEGHPESPYHSWITIRVDSVLKGSAGRAEIIVKIISGPLDDKGRSLLKVHDAQFTEKEKVLLFLSTIPMRLLTSGVPPGRSRRYFDSSLYFENIKTTIGYYEIWSEEAKWTITDEIASRRLGTETSRLKNLIDEIGRVNETTFKTGGVK